MNKHREAINADLMERGYTLNDVGGALTWDALDCFISKTRPGSALSYELDPERAQWGTIDGTNAILADIYDLLAAINYNMTSLLSGRKQKKPKTYERPGQKKERKHIGNASVPVGEIKDLILRKLKNGG